MPLKTGVVQNPLPLIPGDGAATSRAKTQWLMQSYTAPMSLVSGVAFQTMSINFMQMLGV